MTKRECFEKIAGCFFFNFANESEGRQNRKGQFEKVMGSRLPEDYINFLWDWGLFLELDMKTERNEQWDIGDEKLVDAIVSLYQMPCFSGIEIDASRNVLEKLEKLFVQRHTWDGWVLEDMYYRNVRLFQQYKEMSKYHFNKGRPQNAKPAIVAWKLYFVISFEEQDNAISLTNSKLATITDFIDFFQLYDYPDCNDRMNFEREAIKARMNYYRKKHGFERLQWYCNTLKKQFLGGDSSAIDSYSTCMLDMVELLHL